MQTKSSYRLLKWTFMVGAVASLATACVVSVGDGSGTLGEAGDSGTTTAGKPSTGGSGTNGGAGESTTAGKPSTGGGGSGGSGGSVVATAGDDAGGAGGAGSGYVAGLCDDDLATPSNPRDTTLNADDNLPKYACRKCLKVKCKESWSTCYGDTPTVACGYGSTADKLGQFECIRSCFVDDTSGGDTETVLASCESKCLDQCATKDQGFATSDTQALLDCGQTNCLADCFTP